MTREEATERLKTDIYKYADFTENPNEDEFWMAFDMAIKALEHPEQNVVAIVPCGDVISRDAVLDIDFHKLIHTTAKPAEMIRQKIEQLPPVNPQEPKTGHWIEDDMTYCGVDLTNYKCDKCGEIGGAWRKGLKPDKLPKYCMNCGAKMVEPQESEEKE
jgi:hypothetical protein